MTTTESWFYEERYYDGHGMEQWIACGAGAQWTFKECQERAMHRKHVSQKSVLRIVSTFRSEWTWKERTKIQP